MSNKSTCFLLRHIVSVTKRSVMLTMLIISYAQSENRNMGDLSKSSRAEVPNSISVEPSEIVNIRNEKLKLSKYAPNAWQGGTVLSQTRGGGKNGRAVGALVPKSVIITHNNVLLHEGNDYILESLWGSVGIGSDSCVTPDDEVSVDYSCSQLRIDTLIRSGNGIISIIKGQSHITTPLPPALGKDQIGIANIFVDYHSDGRDNIEFLPICESSICAVTQTTSGLIPKTLEKLKTGKPVKIVCWGDSVTAGGEASTNENSYTSLFRKKVEEKFSFNKQISFVVVAIGGSNSAQWLFPQNHSEAKSSDWWQRVIDARPDLVTIEFVNDAYLNDINAFTENYKSMLSRLRAIDAEVILIAPHFTRGMPKDKDSRKYVSNLKNFARQNQVAMADVSARWEHLYKEGIPYITLLRNGFNHPDDRGHLIYAEELIKCFE